MSTRALLFALAAGIALAACGGSSTASPSLATGVLATTPTASPSPAGSASLAGNYNGTWNNTTFGSSGTIAVAFTVSGAITSPNGAVASALVTVTGQVFGGNAPAPVTFSGTLDAVHGFSSSSTVATFGHCVISVDLMGVVTVHCDQVPNSAISALDAHGTWTAAGGSLTYTVTFANGQAPANGRVALARG